MSAITGGDPLACSLYMSPRWSRVPLPLVGAGRTIKIMAGRKRHSAEEIVRKLRRADELAAEGRNGEEIAAALEVSAATLYNRCMPSGLRFDYWSIIGRTWSPNAPGEITSRIAEMASSLPAIPECGASVRVRRDGPARMTSIDRRLPRARLSPWRRRCWCVGAHWPPLAGRGHRMSTTNAFDKPFPLAGSVWSGRWTAFDWETTGLDVGQDRIVSCAVVSSGGGTREWLVDVDVPVSVDAFAVQRRPPNLRGPARRRSAHYARPRRRGPHGARQPARILGITGTAATARRQRIAVTPRDSGRKRTKTIADEGYPEKACRIPTIRRRLRRHP